MYVLYTQILQNSPSLNIIFFTYMGLKLDLVHYLMWWRNNNTLQCDYITAWTADLKLTLKQWDKITFDIINWKWKYVALIDDLCMEIRPLRCWGVIRWESSHRCCELDTWDYCQKGLRGFYMGLTTLCSPLQIECWIQLDAYLEFVQNWRYAAK